MKCASEVVEEQSAFTRQKRECGYIIAMCARIRRTGWPQTGPKSEERIDQKGRKEGYEAHFVCVSGRNSDHTLEWSESHRRFLAREPLYGLPESKRPFLKWIPTGLNRFQTIG